MEELPPCLHSADKHSENQKSYRDLPLAAATEIKTRSCKSGYSTTIDNNTPSYGMHIVTA